MKIAHLSDLHYANETLGEVERCVSFAVDDAIARQVQCVVISGDSTDHRLDVHSPAFIALVKQVRKLSDHCPVLMLQGTFSHEPPGTLDVFRLINGQYPVFVADTICQVALVNNAWVQSNGWAFSPDEIKRMADASELQAIFTCVPTVNKAVVAETVSVYAASEAVGQHLDVLMHAYAQSNVAARINHIPTIGVGHGTVNGCKTEHGVPMMGLDHEFGTGSLFSALCSAVMLGHIHAHQSWDQDGRKIAYPGSIGRLHYGEEDAKGYLLWDVGHEGADFQLVETPARKMVHLEFRGAPDLDALRDMVNESKGAFVRVRWHIDEEHRDSADREAVMTILSQAAEVKLEQIILPVVRTRAAGMNQQESLLDKLKMYCQTTGTPDDGLAERLETLLTKAPEEIAALV